MRKARFLVSYRGSTRSRKMRLQNDMNVTRLSSLALFYAFFFFFTYYDYIQTFINIFQVFQTFILQCESKFLLKFLRNAGELEAATSRYFYRYKFILLISKTVRLLRRITGRKIVMKTTALHLYYHWKVACTTRTCIPRAHTWLRTCTCGRISRRYYTLHFYL